MASGIRVLHVDDDPQFTDLAAAFLPRHGDDLTVESAHTVEDALARLDAERIDCVVSDHDLTATTGIDFLETVRERYPDLPFILFTSKGSEEVASRAISAGVTDYLQKQRGTEQFELLANRIEHAVERLRSQRTADNRKRRLETLVSNLPGMIYQCRNESGWPMEYVAGETERLVGYTPEELQSGDVEWGADVLHPDERERTWEIVQEAIEDDEPFECTYRVVASDGSIKWMWERGRITERPPSAAELTAVDGETERVLEGFITDITPLKEREAELERSERRFRAIFEDPNVLVGLLAPDGTVRDVNRTALEYVDAEREELIGAAFRETPWWPETSRPDVDEWIERAASGAYVEFESKHPVPGGDSVFVEGMFRPVTDDEGAVTAIVVSARDVTARRERERELRRQHDRLDEFASFISHDFQTPIATARGRLELALETDDEAHIERAIDAVDRIDELRTDLAETLRNGEVVADPEPIAVEEALEYVWATADPGAGASYEVVDPVEIEADPEAFHRLLQNLVRNSIEHGDDDVTVRMGPLEDGFFYEDDGPGVDPSIREELFAPGFSTKPDGTGVGLGMASVRQVVAGHGWEIEVTDASALGGARFEIRDT
ncbi:PAS domain S-box protein [Halobellus rubicundus]|uniref:histidine kinase n=1 Tax=Halobellus rubicundus TaxID=2996466 RepID=A0ABD5MF91_9EURY